MRKDYCQGEVASLEGTQVSTAEGTISIKQRVKNLRKALETIEGICLANETQNAIAMKCYRFAHITLGGCKAEHLDWLVELNKTHKTLKDLKII